MSTFKSGNPKFYHSGEDFRTEEHPTESPYHEICINCWTQKGAHDGKDLLCDPEIYLPRDQKARRLFYENLTKPAITEII